MGIKVKGKLIRAEYDDGRRIHYFTDIPCICELDISEEDIFEIFKKNVIEIYKCKEATKEILSLLTGSEGEKEGEFTKEEIDEIEKEAREYCRPEAKEEKSCESCKHCQKQESGINHCKLKIIAESSAMFTDCIKKGFAKWKPKEKKEEKRSCSECEHYRFFKLDYQCGYGKKDYKDCSIGENKYFEPKQPPKVDVPDWDFFHFSVTDGVFGIFNRLNKIVDIVRTIYEKVEGEKK